MSLICQPMSEIRGVSKFKWTVGHPVGQALFGSPVVFWEICLYYRALKQALIFKHKLNLFWILLWRCTGWQGRMSHRWQKNGQNGMHWPIQPILLIFLFPVRHPVQPPSTCKLLISNHNISMLHTMTPAMKQQVQEQPLAWKRSFVDQHNLLVQPSSSANSLQMSLSIREPER